MAVDSGTYTPETVLRERKLAEALLMGSMQPRQIDHWTQGAAQMAQAGVGAMAMRKADEDDKSDRSALANAMLGMMGNGGSPSAIPQQAPQVPSVPGNTPMAGDIGNYGKAISSVESGGKYDALGPVTKTGDRAYGKYQVMGANIGPWSREALGRELTPAAFVQDPAAQDAIFQKQFGSYVDNYGPEGAAKAWFAGEKGMNNPNAKDILGTTVSGYADKFNKALGPQMAQMQQPQQSAIPSAQPPQPDMRAQIAAMLQSKSPRVQAMGQSLAQSLIGQQMKPNELKPMVAGENLYAFDPRTGKATVAGGATKPTYGVIGKDQFGNEQYGWIDPSNRSTTPANAQNAGQPTAAPQTPSIEQSAAAVPPAGAIPPAPPGADPKEWRKTMTEQAAKTAAAQPEKDKQQKQIADIVTTDIDRAMKKIDEGMFPTTGAMGGLLSNIGGTAARDLAGLLDTVKANAGFQELSKMRAASPTGGALGSITERELALLQSTIGNLEQSQTEQQLKDNLQRVKNVYLDIIHGPGKGPERATLSFKETPGAPKAGIIENGYRFKGGNPGDPKNWEIVK